MAESEEPASKKQKLEEFHKVRKDLNNFQATKVLREDAAKKLLVIEVEYKAVLMKLATKPKPYCFLNEIQ